MSFSYKNLWNTLERRGMSKTDLRQKLSLSTATLAKLSSDQPVALEVLDKICEALGCSLGDVMTHQPDSLSLVPWSHISDEQTYLVNFFFRFADTQASYIYGFATPYRMTEDGMSCWSLSPFTEDTDFLILRGYASGKQLLTILQGASEQKTIGQLLEAIRVKLTLSKCTHTEQDAISSLLLCNGAFVYRPAFLLPTPTECAGLTPQQNPLLTFDGEIMYCESLFGTSKKALYCGADGFPETTRLRALWQLFRSELPVHGSLNEMARLNNFEIFSPLLPLSESDAAITWEIECSEQDMKKIPENIVVRFDHRFLQGQYFVNVCAYNTQNPFLDFSGQVFCGEEDAILRLPLQEGLSHASVKVWKESKGTGGSNLIYSSTHAMMRHIHLNMHMTSRSFQIEDDWTRKMEQKNLPVDTKGSFSSSHPTAFGMEDDEVWLSEERAVQKDFHERLGGSNSSHTEAFFREGSDKHMQFLDWLKKLLAASHIHRVILIDPFITAEAINKLLRSISNTGVSYEIITDTAAGRTKADREQRIAAIRSMEGFLDIINPGHLKISAVNTSDVFLHDRYLILLGENQMPEAYVLTNSLDKLAELHASVALPASKSLSRKIFDYYLEHFSAFQENNQLELLYDAQTAYKQSRKSAPSFQKAREHYTLSDFQPLLSSNLPAALESLAHMYWEEQQQCYNYVLSLHDTSLLPRLIALLTDYPEHKDEEDQKADAAMLLSAAQHLLLPFDAKGELLHYSSLLSDYCYEFTRSHCSWEMYFAAKLLWKLNPSAYCEHLERIRKSLARDRSFSNHRLFRLAAIMIGHIAEELALDHSSSTQLALSALFASDIPLLRAMATVQVLRLPELQAVSEALIDTQLQTLQQALSPKERLLAGLYQIKELQVLICRHPKEQEVLQPRINQIIDAIVAAILSIAPSSDANEIFSNDDLYEYLLLLYTRNSEDICRIIQSLQSEKYLSREETTQLLIRLFFQKYRKGFSDTNEYFRENDLQESCMILRYLSQINAAGSQLLKKELSKLERQLNDRLYHAFLKTKNYNLWKTSIDLYCCLVFIELWIAKEYGLNPSPAVREFEGIADNFRTTLENYSEVYAMLVHYFPEMG